MISTFDLTLMGSLVSIGGLVFLLQEKRLYPGWRWLSAATPESRAGLERSTALAGARWLTVGALTLFLAFTHGAEEGYLFGPWSDVLFHAAFVSACWVATTLRMTQAAAYRPAPRTQDDPLSPLSLAHTRSSLPRAATDRRSLPGSGLCDEPPAG